jgi:hypothetical protein
MHQFACDGRSRSFRHAGIRAQTWSKHATAHDSREEVGEESTYCIERGKALYSSGDINFSPARLNMAGSCSPLRRRLLVTLCRSGVLGFDLGFVVVQNELFRGKHSGRREEDDDAARLHVSVPNGPACCWCPAASRKAITIPCLALETGTKESR